MCCIREIIQCTTWIAGSEIAVIRKVKNQIFISCCQYVVKCAGSVMSCQNISNFVHANIRQYEIHLPFYTNKP